MKKRYILLFILLVIFVGIPLILHLSWNLTTPRELNVLTVNKSVLNQEDFNRQSYHWVLKHRKYAYCNGDLYKPGDNHLGFFPLQNKKFRINDFSHPALRKDNLVENTDLVYFADNYGVYSHEWYNAGEEDMPFYLVYGGLCMNDLDFIQAMLRQEKTVIAEYNFFSPPTPEDVRQKAGRVLGIEWQGWAGRFFPTLDSSDTELLPSWVVSLYREQNQGRWDFRKQGIGFVNQDNIMVILEYPTHLLEPAPAIITADAQRRRFGVPRKVPFAGWFDIVKPSASGAELVSWYNIPVNKEGEKILQQYNIPAKFPAVIHKEGPGNFYYFAGDFGKSPISERMLRFKGARYLELFLTDLRDPAARDGFFFSYYLPITTSIFKETSRAKQTTPPGQQL